MGACCVGAEVLYLAAHAATDPRIANIAGPLARVLPASVHLPTPAFLGWDLSLGVRRRCGSAGAGRAAVLGGEAGGERGAAGDELRGAGGARFSKG